jgi:hypothetical protein|uniref:Glycine-rich domain-containing protein n=1 Tax=viral metagenome TaxID=1070528 RepID=A0A6C0IPC2_9ZZZZ
MANYYVNSRKLVGDGTNEDCILTQYNNSSSNLSNCLQVGSSVYQRNESDYKVSNNVLSFYTTNYLQLRCNLSSGYNVSSNTDITENALISYRIHKVGNNGTYSCNGANKLKVLLVGGGGGGGFTYKQATDQNGKGGGGTGRLELFNLTPQSGTFFSNYSVTVGQGGKGAKIQSLPTGGENSSTGVHGEDSEINVYSSNDNIIIAAPGGFGIRNTGGGGSGGGEISRTLLSNINYSSIHSQSVAGGDEVGNAGSSKGGAAGLYNTNPNFPIPNILHMQEPIKKDGNTGWYDESNRQANNNTGYNIPINSNDRNSFGIGGGGAGGANSRGGNYQQNGADGADGLIIVFFRYD